MKDENKDIGAKQDVQSPNSIPRDNDIPYTRFTKNEKWFIVGLTAAVGLFSPLTANIYFPAIPTLSRAFNKSTELINLTVTMYMVLQGVAPMVWGTVSDHVGRRPISAVCLLILSLSCVGLALVPTSDYWLLMVLRCLQAAGSASTIAIGAGVIGDISSREERAGFFGIFTLGPMVGPAIGPVIGGALADHLGWRSIFWFLCIAASICFLGIILFQPETLNSLVDSGRDKTPIIYQPVVPIIGRKAAREQTTRRVKVPRNPFRLFANADILIYLALNAIICAVYYGVIATISTLFETVYPFLNETKIGLCFLAVGGGMIVGSSVIGRVLDWEYKTFKRKTIVGLSVEKNTLDLTKEERFPLEQARLRLMPILVLFMAASCAGYGWCLQRKVNIAVPLILQFIVGFVSIGVMNSASTLMIDLVPGQSSSVTACNNLVRCTLSAVLVSVIELIIKGIGIGWTYILLGGITLLSLPLIYLSFKVGPRCRVKRQKLQEEELARIVEGEK
ncbi:major facilitator superfamily domain-containing protein [Crassisporium funariophilum]|nr:major facilitator superfamily domain-containing protein [Crassisporium funariophilum]